MFRWILWNLLYGMATPSRSVYVYNDVTVENDGGESYVADDCDYAADCDSGGDSGGE